MVQMMLFSDGIAGTTTNYVHDDTEEERINSQVEAVRDILQRNSGVNGMWFTFEELRSILKQTYGIIASEAGISARIRDLRKPKFGGHTIERRLCGEHLYEYRMVK